MTQISTGHTVAAPHSVSKTARHDTHPHAVFGTRNFCYIIPCKTRLMRRLTFINLFKFSKDNIFRRQDPFGS